MYLTVRFQQYFMRIMSRECYETSAVPYFHSSQYVDREISGSHGGKYDDYSLLGYSTV
jgi:hypothetical protein